MAAPPCPLCVATKSRMVWQSATTVSMPSWKLAVKTSYVVVWRLHINIWILWMFSHFDNHVNLTLSLFNCEAVIFQLICFAKIIHCFTKLLLLCWSYFKNGTLLIHGLIDIVALSYCKTCVVCVPFILQNLRSWQLCENNGSWIYTVFHKTHART